MQVIKHLNLVPKLGCLHWQLTHQSSVITILSDALKGILSDALNNAAVLFCIDHVFF